MQDLILEQMQDLILKQMQESNHHNKKAKQKEEITQEEPRQQ